MVSFPCTLDADRFENHINVYTICIFAVFHLSNSAALMSTVYEEQKDEDGFLYVQYSGESTFGN